MIFSAPRWPFLFLVLLAWVPVGRAVESWTDPRLPVTHDVAAWFDVSRQNAARGARQQVPLRSWADSVDRLYDGSGRRRDLVQPLLASRPRFRQEFNGAMLGFDGTNDFLMRTEPGWRATHLTLFLVAAPRRITSFAGPVAASAIGRNDYHSGFNLDFGGLPQAGLIRVNLEGAGFPGERDLLNSTDAGVGPWMPAQAGLDRWHVFTVAVGTGSSGVALAVDGARRGTRERPGSEPLALEEWVLGARHYSNTPDRPHAQGFFAGDLTEVLLYDRLLPEAERRAVEAYLGDKYGALLRGLGAAPVKEGAVPLVMASNPPPVQVHFPGFSSRELPVDLGNVNNLRYRPDGSLLAVGYDGRVWRLRDLDGDGREETVEAFWDRTTFRAPIGAALTPPGYPRGDGLFLACKDRLVLLVDTNRDDRADLDLTVATWTERSMQQGVDALGVAVGPDGSVYFSLGSASFVEPYLIDTATGQAGYRTTMERGTLLKVSPDFRRREIVATGIRFAVGMAFNREGDLFVTDQEGATWRPDGNPLDELLHIQPGRHYGFPPRHPRHLPGVVDEPSVFDYGPQHQSTCGLAFNDPVNGGPVFGSPDWAGEALVAGYSRGKLWRTRLAKTEAGYVGQTHLLATLQALTVDACVSPRGDLVVATHGGQPDWGTGPGGKGRLWQIRRPDGDTPLPVAAWNPDPSTLRVAFDRPVDPEWARGLAARARIESGPFVHPGDRFETIRPGYQIVYDQLAAPRHRHEILGAGLSPDRRTLSLSTRPRRLAVNQVVTLPSGSARAGGADEGMDLLSTLHGVEVRGDGWGGWLPHLDLAVARAFTRGSAEHAALFQRLAQPGRVVFRGALDLWQMLQPAIQPGSAIDWERPPENVRVRFVGTAPFEVRSGEKPGVAAAGTGGRWVATLEFPAVDRSWRPFELSTAGGPGLELAATWSASLDLERWRPFPLRRFLLPWAQPLGGEAAPAAAGRELPGLAGGNWARGRRLFHGEKLACARCHRIHGEGMALGPDLSNLVHRDLASVRQDIEFPNATLNPDHPASLLEMKSGETVTGILRREEAGHYVVAHAGGPELRVARADVRAVLPAGRSLMPEGLWAALSAGEQRDLLAFLMTELPGPAEVAPEAQGQKLPPPRKRAEVEAVLAAGTPAPTNPPPMRVVLCASPKDAGHGAPGFHDYPLWRERWARLLALAENVQVETAERWPSPAQWAAADVVAFYHDNPAWVADRAADLDVFLARGGGLVFLHWSMNAYRDLDALKPRLGRAWGPGARFRYGPEELAFAAHPLTAGLPRPLAVVDEAYWNLPGEDAGSTVLATSVEDGQPRPQAWVREAGKGRVFVCIPGHFTWTFDDPLYRVFWLRGLAWAARQAPDRFAELVWVGARVAEGRP